MHTMAEREAVRVAIRVLIEKDRAAGERKEPAHYKDLFPGFWDVVAEEFGRHPEAASTVVGVAAPPAPEEGPGERIGPYHVLRELGRGGMGVVYEAADTRLPRRVALKVLSPQFAASPQLRLRFQREAELASKLDHPHICTIYEAGEEDGTPFLAMRFVEGRPLSDLLVATREAQRTSGLVRLPARGEPAAAPASPRTTETRLELDRVLHLFEKAARALHAAHEKGLIHRDVKPHNLMVTAEGEPVLLDFGLAREEAGEGHQLTQTGSILGTPAYMSPEQLLAAKMRLDRRTDVYSLGVSLYECVTLRLPFEAPTVDRLYQKILATDPEDPRRLNRALPEDLKVVLATAMEKDRERRYGTALDLAEELRRIREREPIRARPPGALYRAVRFVQRNAPVVMGVAVAALCVGAILWTVLSARIGQTPETLAAIAGDLRAAGEDSAAIKYYGLALEKGGWDLAALPSSVRERPDPVLKSIAAGYGPLLEKTALELRKQGLLRAARTTIDAAVTCADLERDADRRQELRNGSIACRQIQIAALPQAIWIKGQACGTDWMHWSDTGGSVPEAYATTWLPALADPAHPERRATGERLAYLRATYSERLPLIAALEAVAPASLLEVIPGGAAMDDARYGKMGNAAEIRKATAILLARKPRETTAALATILEHPALPARESALALSLLAEAADLCPAGPTEGEAGARLLLLAKELLAADRADSWRRRVAFALERLHDGGVGAEAWLLARTGRGAPPAEGWDPWWEARKGLDPAAIVREGLGLSADAARDPAALFEGFATSTPATAPAWHALLELALPAGAEAPAWPAVDPEGGRTPPPAALGGRWYAAFRGRIPTRSRTIEVVSIAAPPGRPDATVAWSASRVVEVGETVALQGDRSPPREDEDWIPVKVGLPPRNWRWQPEGVLAWWPRPRRPALDPAATMVSEVRLRVDIDPGRGGPVLRWLPMGRAGGRSWQQDGREIGGASAEGVLARPRSRGGVVLARLVGDGETPAADRLDAWRALLVADLRALERHPNLHDPSSLPPERAMEFLLEVHARVRPASILSLPEAREALDAIHARLGRWPAGKYRLLHSLRAKELALARLLAGNEAAGADFLGREAMVAWDPTGDDGLRVSELYREEFPRLLASPSPAIRALWAERFAADGMSGAGRDLRAAVRDAIDAGRIPGNAVRRRDWEPPPPPWRRSILPAAVAVAIAVVLLRNLVALLRPDEPIEARLRPAWMLVWLGSVLGFLQIGIGETTLPTATLGFLPALLGLQVLASAARGWKVHLPAACATLGATAAFLRTQAGSGDMRNYYDAAASGFVLMALASLPALTSGIRAAAAPGAAPAPAGSRGARLLASDRALAIASLPAIVLTIAIAAYSSRLSWSSSEWELDEWLAWAPGALWILWALAALRTAVDRAAGTPSLPVRAWRRLRRWRTGRPEPGTRR